MLGDITCPPTGIAVEVQVPMPLLVLEGLTPLHHQQLRSPLTRNNIISHTINSININTHIPIPAVTDKACLPILPRVPLRLPSSRHPLIHLHPLPGVADMILTLLLILTDHLVLHPIMDLIRMEVILSITHHHHPIITAIIVVPPKLTIVVISILPVLLLLVQVKLHPIQTQITKITTPQLVPCHPQIIIIEDHLVDTDHHQNTTPTIIDTEDILHRTTKRHTHSSKITIQQKTIIVSVTNTAPPTPPNPPESPWSNPISPLPIERA